MSLSLRGDNRKDRQEESQLMSMQRIQGPGELRTPTTQLTKAEPRSVPKAVLPPASEHLSGCFVASAIREMQGRTKM